MRYTLSLAVLGIALGFTGAPAFAQQQQQQQSYTYGGQQNTAPVYNSAGSYGDDLNAGSFYNSGANLQLLPMQQMVAGKDAPSYSYGGQQQQNQANLFNSNSFLDGSAMGSLSPDQARAIRAQRDQQAQAYQQQYMENQRLQQQNDPYAQPQNGASQYQGAAFSQLYADNEQKKPVKKKVLYKQLNNPLVAPPRLFNIDQ